MCRNFQSIYAELRQPGKVFGLLGGGLSIIIFDLSQEVRPACDGELPGQVTGCDGEVLSPIHLNYNQLSESCRKRTENEL